MSNTIPLLGKPGQPSEKLLSKEYEKLVALYESCGSFSEIARKLRMERMTITRILKSGSGSPVNVQKLRTKLSKQKALPKRKAA